MRDVRARDIGLGSRARGHHLMSGKRQLYAVTDWMVERRASGWYFSRYRDRQNKADWRGSYSSEASIAMMIARQLRREIAQRSGPPINGGAS